jgi:hypothetical protein
MPVVEFGFFQGFLEQAELETTRLDLLLPPLFGPLLSGGQLDLNQ